jgi:hypothetical protein
MQAGEERPFLLRAEQYEREPLAETILNRPTKQIDPKEILELT